VDNVPHFCAQSTCRIKVVRIVKAYDQGVNAAE
jgi:hypothetical protein